MPSVKDILKYIRINQGDLYSQLLYVERIIKQNSIFKVFTNFENKGFLCNYINSNCKKISFNSLDKKHFGEYDNFENVKFINKPLENVNIQEYDLIHLNCNHNFDDWCSYIKRILRNNPKFIILSNTKLKETQTKCIINCIYKKKYEIIKIFKGYYGCVVFKLVK